jgi:MSHA biogenesis protein MshJ
MKQLWQKYAGKIDALSLRERLMVFAGVVAGTVFVAYTLFIDPAVTGSKALSMKMAQQQTELQVLRITIQALEKRQADPDAVQSARRDDLNRKIAEIDTAVKSLQSGLVPAQRMNVLLRDMLARNSRLQLVALRTLPVTPLVEKHDAADKPNTAEQTSRTPDKTQAGTRNVFKHGVQITLQGSYADLHDYLAGLEKLPWHMFWSRASMSAEDYPRLLLTVTIYTLSLDKAWLVV